MLGKTLGVLALSLTCALAAPALAAKAPAKATVAKASV